MHGNGKHSRLLMLTAVAFSSLPSAQTRVGQTPAEQSATATPKLAGELAVGDVVFIRVGAYPFRMVAETTDTWTNHVGIVVAVDGKEPVIAESTFPFSRLTGLTRFIARSEGGRVAVSRFDQPLTDQQQAAIKQSAERRLGIFYDTGFNLHSKRQFCSRFVHEVFSEAVGVELGEVDTFATLLTRNPNANVAFWRRWYFGRIPWQRETVTPASLLHNPRLAALLES